MKAGFMKVTGKGQLPEQLALAGDLHETSLHHVNHWGLVLFFRVLQARRLGHQGPQLVDVDDGADLAVLDQVEIAHAHLSEISRVVLVKIDAVVMLSARISDTARVLTVLADAAAPSRDLAAVAAVLLVARGHRCEWLPSYSSLRGRSAGAGATF